MPNLLVLSRNEAALAAASTPAERAELQARQAILMARLRRPREAELALAAAEASAAQAPSVRLQIVVAIAAAMIDLSRREIDAVVARLQATAAQARAASLPAWEVEALAVLAVVHAAALDIAGLVRCVQQAAPSLDQASDDARYRLHLALGTAHHYAGDFAAAQERYRLAHEAATAALDDLALQVLAHSMAISRVFELRQRTLARTAGPQDLEASAAALRDSIGRMQAEVAPEALVAERVLLAELLCRCGRTEAALEQLERLDPPLGRDAPVALAALAAAVRAVGLLARGDTDGAVAAAQQALAGADAAESAAFGGTLHADAARVLRAVGDPDAAAVLEQRADEASHALVQRQREARGILAAAGL